MRYTVRLRIGIVSVISLIVCLHFLMSSLTSSLKDRNEDFFLAFRHPEDGVTMQETHAIANSLKVLKKADHDVYYGFPKILCWILTQDKNLKSKAQAVKDTWGKRCDKTLYFSSSPDTTFPAIGLNLSEGRQHLTEKTFQAFTHCFRHHGDQFDWFLKADDDTYVIVENLKAFLRQFNPQQKTYFGYRFKLHTPQGFMSGGASYVLSQEALRVFVEQGLVGRKCQPSSQKQIEDLDMGICLSQLGVRAMDTIDDQGRERFHPLNLLSYIEKRFMAGWLHNHTMYPVKMGRECCSEQTISFHYVRPPEMYSLDILLYHIKISKTSLGYL